MLTAELGDAWCPAGTDTLLLCGEHRVRVEAWKEVTTGSATVLSGLKSADDRNPLYPASAVVRIPCLSGITLVVKPGMLSSRS